MYAKGDYTVEIKYNNSVYGIYYLTVQESAPIAVDYSNIEDQVFYAGFGHKEILNYVDSIVTVPAIDSSVTTYSVVAKIDEETDVVLQETVYNNFSSSVIRIAISLEEYAKGVTTQNIFAKYQINSEDVYEACSITFAPRYSIIYNGYPVNIAYYGNILDTAEEASIDDETKDQNVVTYNLNIKLNCDIVAEAEIETLYYVTCDINVNTNNEEINYTLNANEYEDGLSLVDMFNINDNLGNKFWINHIAENKVISLTYDSHIDAVTGKNINNAKANSILLEPTEIDFDGTKLSYDYSLIAMGATNNGTVVALTFKYIVDEITYAKTIKIKVISDIEYSLLNNDGNNTPNSESNPLILKNIKSYTIADASQTSMDSSKYYIYAYGKYDKSKKNVAQTLIVSQDGYGNFGACSKSGDNLIFTYGTRATFGDKHVVLTLTDNYGFSFKYYITLVSTNRITGVQLTQEAYFEDSDLVVFNRNKTPITVNTGISVNLEDAEGMTDSTTVIQIESINIYVTIDGKETPLQNSNIENAYYINYSVNNAGSVIKFNYQNQDFWMLGDNNKAVTLKLRIAIVGKTDEDSQPGEETYTLTSTIVLCKRYEMSVKEENTYVRDDVPFELEHLVSVYDYSISSYLGEASIEKAEAIKLNFALNENYTESKTIEVVEYTDEYQKSHNAKLILDKLNIYKLMIARAKTDNGKYDVEGLGEFEIKYTVDDQEKTVNTFDDKTAEIILNALNINYVNDEKPYYTQTIKIIAINKESGKETESKYATVKYVYDNGIMKCAEDNFIYLGIHQTAFGTTELNIENFNYEVYYDDVLIAQTAEVIKETGVTNVTTALLTNITTEKTIAGKDGEEDKKVNYYHPIATLAEVSVLNVASYSGKLLSGDVSVDCFVLIDSGEEQLSPIYLNKGSNVIYLENYANSKVELYTGYVTVTGSESFVYTKSTVEDENKLVCYNGFLKEQVMLAKNIHKVTLFDSDGNQITEFDDEGNSKASKQSLSVEKSFSIDNDGVLYQDISSKVQIEFLSNTYTESDYYTYTNVEDIRVTLKYTSIDTSNAYVGTTGIHLVEIAEDKFGVLANDLTINLMDTETEAEGEETKLIAGWAQDFKLVPGVGRTKELSMQTEKDQLSFASAIERKYIKFALKAVTSSSGGELTAGSLVSLNETNGDLTLLKNFDTTLYYVTIDVSCKYPTADGASETSWQSIGTVRLGFQTTQQ